MPENRAEDSTYQYSRPNAETTEFKLEEAAAATTMDAALHAEHVTWNETSLQSASAMNMGACADFHRRQHRDTKIL